MLKKKAVNKEWNVIMGPYWDSLPKQGTLNTKETFPRSSLSLLQDDSMVFRISPFPALMSFFALATAACVLYPYLSRLWPEVAQYV